jgi:hypothetical protein
LSADVTQNISTAESPTVACHFKTFAMRQKIVEIDTFIKNKELYFSIFRETDLHPAKEFQEINYLEIFKKVLPFSVYELELLEDCFLEPGGFYKRGERMRNGKVATNDSEFPKSWKFTYEGTLEQLRARSQAKLLDFQSIYSVEISQKNSQHPYVIITTTENNKYKHLLNLFKGLVGINEDEFHLLRGVSIAPVMYKRGETFQSAGKYKTVREDDKMVAKFNFRIESTLEHHHSLFGNQEMKVTTAKVRGNGSWYYDDSDRYVSRYEKYNGYNGFDDDTIDNAFEGDPSATWNVD